jgi:hypothetical protein
MTPLHRIIADPVEAVIAIRIVIRTVTVDVAVEAVLAVPKMILPVLETDVKIAVIAVETLIVSAVVEAMLVRVVLAARRRTETVNAMPSGETPARERRCAGGTDGIATTGLRKWVALLSPTAATPTRMKAAPVHHPQWVHHLLPRRLLHLPFRMMAVGGKAETAATAPRTETGSGSAVTAGASAMAITVRAVVAPRIANVAGPTTPRTIPGGMRMLVGEWAAITSAPVAGSDSTECGCVWVKGAGPD